MEKLKRNDLWSLEEYAEKRSEFKKNVIAHKLERQLAIGPNATLYFEDRLTIQYQIQEMLRIERIFEATGVNEELATYNPLIPDGHNWKATFMIEFAEEAERRAALTRMRGIEDALWIQVEGQSKVSPFANEDMERTNDNKTSAVHFLRFELAQEMITSLKAGAGLSMGITHQAYQHVVNIVPQTLRQQLLEDLE